MRRIAQSALLATLGFTLCGCPTGSGHKPQSLPSTWTDQHQEHDAGVALSLFQGTPMLNNPPDAVSFSRDGGTVWVHGMDREKNEYYLSQSEVTADGLHPGFFTHGPDMIVSYVQSSPDGEECLIQSQYQPASGGPVRDVIYRAGEGLPEKLEHRSVVPWENLQGLPRMQEEMFAFTKPLYSWDGATIIIPFNGVSGAAVVDRRTGSGKYVPYPATGLPNGYTDKAFGQLQDEDGKRRIWGSFWYRGGNGSDDFSEVYMLDLDALKWELAFTVPWPAYHCVATTPTVEPWLVAGAYSSLINADKQSQEYKRSGYYVPRLARVVPGAGAEDLVSVFGEPVWEIALDPLGSKVFYADMQRKALVRYSPADGQLDYDPRWYSADDTRTHVFCMGGGDRCFIWQGEILIQAEFTKHEKQKGYE